MALAAKARSAPLGEINTTPLIDVMLVLLIMIIVTIPAATHSLAVDLPGPPMCTRDCPQTIKNRLTVSPQGTLRWNGAAVSDAQLIGLLRHTRAMNPAPELQFEPDPLASYARSAAVLRMIDAAHVPSFGFIGNERYRAFGR